MDLPLAWALRLDGKTDQEKFEELGWGLRTWDQWNINECDDRFGDDWPGRIPAQLVAHALFYFSTPGDLVLDPMAGGGVVSDVRPLTRAALSGKVLGRAALSGKVLGRAALSEKVLRRQRILKELELYIGIFEFKDLAC